MPNLSIDDIWEKLEKFLILNSDWREALELVLAVPVSLRYKTTPAWVMLVSGPSTGKSELLRLIQDSDLAFWMDDLSSKTLVSGYRDEVEERRTGEKTDPSIAKKIHGKTLIMNDLSRVLGKGQESRMIMDHLRILFDGQIKAAYGNDNIQTIYSDFNVLCGCTGEIDNMTANTVSLGERFLYYRSADLPLEERVRRASSAAKRDRLVHKYRRDAALITRRFLEKSKFAEPEMTPEQTTRIANLAELVVAWRPNLNTDWSGEVLSPPIREGSTRVSGQLGTIARGIGAIKRRRTLENEDLAIIEKLVLYPDWI